MIKSKYFQQLNTSHHLIYIQQDNPISCSERRQMLHKRTYQKIRQKWPHKYF